MNTAAELEDYKQHEFRAKWGSVIEKTKDACARLEEKTAAAAKALLTITDPQLAWAKTTRAARRACGLWMGLIFLLPLATQVQSLGSNPSPANLTWVVTNQNLVLSWPADRIGWALQAQTNTANPGVSTSWLMVPGSNLTNRFTTPIDPAKASVFFRMVLRQGEMQLQKGTGLIVPHVAARSDGTTWLSWYEPVGQNYRLRLQRLDAVGRGLLGADGVVASPVDQGSWVMDYDLTTDSNGNAILAWSNTKNYTLHVQQFNAQGSPCWGSSGVAVGSNGFAAYAPKCVRCTNGEIAITWFENQGGTNQGTSQVCVTRMKSNGEFAWSMPFAIEIPTAGVGWPTIVQGADASLILVWVENPVFDGLGDAYAQRIDETGKAIWPAKVNINGTAHLPFQKAPYIVADGSGGLYAAWTTVNGLDWFEGRVQHVDQNGGLLWAADGEPLSTSTTTMQLPSAVTYLPDQERVVVAWKETDQKQTVTGLNVQALDMQADRLWADTGLVIVETNPAVAGLATALRPTDTGAALVFARDSGLGKMSAYVASLPAQSAAAPVETTLSGIPSNKGHPCVSDLVNGGYWLVWEDSRGGLFGAFWTAQ